MPLRVLTAPNLAELDWLTHGFGFRDTVYPPEITTARQIHSCNVLNITEITGDRVGEADALVTARSGVLLGVRTADCVPVLLADTRTRAVAAIHAGWRGTAGNIAAAALRQMTERFGTRACDVRAAVGPSIGACCYTVGPEVASRFATWCSILGHSTETERLDLQQVNRLQLELEGVESVWVSGECTYCAAERYFSFRREREEAGRMLSYLGTVR